MVMTIELMNGQAINLIGPDFPGAPPSLQGLGQSSATPAENFAPWRKTMIPPNAPKGTFASERQWSTPGSIHFGRQDWPRKPYTPQNYERNFPREAGLDFNDERIPKMSYRTRGETFQGEDYWSIDPKFGPEAYPQQRLWPRQPTISEVDLLEHDIFPIPTTAKERGGASVQTLEGLAAVPSYEEWYPQYKSQLIPGSDPKVAYQNWLKSAEGIAAAKEDKADEPWSLTGGIGDISEGISEMLGTGELGEGLFGVALNVGVGMLMQRFQEEKTKEERKLIEAKERMMVAMTEAAKAKAEMDAQAARDRLRRLEEERQRVLAETGPFYTKAEFLIPAGIALAVGAYFMFK